MIAHTAGSVVMAFYRGAYRPSAEVFAMGTIRAISGPSKGLTVLLGTERHQAKYASLFEVRS